ncbi:succinate dehydrogenase cytochrome b [Sarcoptes scabiei]|uniref:Cytochrome C oxidase subunit VIc-like protein n=1 Tax=Sarcoptes scabiei TaxID=52283 RepID=A0A131ZXH1_SARSC|nr:cytochrome C oxidase subunit VIc-like protein [Sarcoptes scabiei]UXI16466.1 succinate dehydrogenase cytochrome b [Sarcoptes scabiei]
MSAAAGIGRIPKPKLRRLLIDSIKFHIPIAVSCAVATQIAFKVFYHDARRDRMVEFYRNYDAEKESERLERIGFFDSD